MRFVLTASSLLLYVAAWWTPALARNPIKVRVGIYENRPKIFTGNQGNASGFWPDIIEHIAAREGWQIEYIHGTWPQCQARLRNNEIDMMPDVAFAEERSSIYQFSKEAVYISWSRIYTRQDSGIESVLDLEGKTIAVLIGSINIEGPGGIKDLLRSFDIDCVLTGVDSYSRVFELVEAGQADAGIVNKDFAYLHEKDFHLVPTPIIFQPARLLFAFPRESSLAPSLIEAIDRHMLRLKKEENSAYYQALEKWFGTKPVERAIFPAWAKLLLLGITVLALLLLGASAILRHQIRVRTRELREAEARFLQAQKLEAVGQLAGGVAHDFNNILTAVIGHCDLMLNQVEKDNPLAGDLAQIKSSGERAAALTRQLLAFSRKQALRPEILDLNAVVANIEEMLRRLIGENIDLVTALAGDLGRVKADPGQIEQVIMNLAVNARDAMPRGGRLTIETANADLDVDYKNTRPSVSPGQYVLLAVKDTGHGMDQKTQDRIFEPFYTTKQPGRGTGLGLSTVYGIVKQSGGDIRTCSEPGQGTTFKIYLPRTGEQPVARTETAGEQKRSGGGKRILAVEDEPVLRDLLERMLQELGYSATVAASGDEALQAVEEGGLRPDLLITDLVMPGMSGAELADRLRKRKPDLKILYMSGYPNTAAAHQDVIDPIKPLLQKPFGIGDLASRIGELLS